MSINLVVEESDTKNYTYKTEKVVGGVEHFSRNDMSQYRSHTSSHHRACYPQVKGGHLAIPCT